MDLPTTPLSFVSLALRITSDWRSEFKVNRRCNPPIPAGLGWTLRATHNVAPMFRHQLRSSNMSDSHAPHSSESSCSCTQLCSTSVHTMQSPHAPQYIELSHVHRYSTISTPPLISLHFACPNPPTCVPTVPTTLVIAHLHPAPSPELTIVPLGRTLCT